MKFVLQRGSQPMIAHKGSGTVSSKAAVHLRLLGRWMHAEARTLLTEVENTAVLHPRQTGRLAVNRGGASLMQADQRYCTAQALCHSHCIQGACEVQEVNVQEGDLHRFSSLVGWSLPLLH